MYLMLIGASTHRRCEHGDVLLAIAANAGLIHVDAGRGITATAEANDLADHPPSLWQATTRAAFAVDTWWATLAETALLELLHQSPIGMWSLPERAFERAPGGLIRYNPDPPSRWGEAPVQGIKLLMTYGEVLGCVTASGFNPIAGRAPKLTEHARPSVVNILQGRAHAPVGKRDVHATLVNRRFGYTDDKGSPYAASLAGDA